MQTNYDINLDILHEHGELIDLPSVVSSIQEKWANRTLTQVNDSVVRMARMEGEFHWHKHDEEDEFFFVLEGKLLMDLEDRTVELNPLQGITISKGVMHRPRAPLPTIILMVESSTIQPTGN